LGVRRTRPAAKDVVRDAVGAVAWAIGTEAAARDLGARWRKERGHFWRAWLTRKVLSMNDRI
jgi:hypothetical protein